jgi:hypothetical protein
MRGKPTDLNAKARWNGVIMRPYRAKACAALGRFLKPTEEVHHHTQTQLVICENHRYHILLHVRERVLRAGGNPNTDAFCTRCRCVKPVADFSPNRAQHMGRNQMCKACERERKRLPPDHPLAKGPRRPCVTLTES